MASSRDEQGGLHAVLNNVHLLIGNLEGRQRATEREVAEIKKSIEGASEKRTVWRASWAQVLQAVLTAAAVGVALYK